MAVCGSVGQWSYVCAPKHRLPKIAFWCTAIVSEAGALFQRDVGGLSISPVGSQANSHLAPAHLLQAVAAVQQCIQFHDTFEQAAADSQHRLLAMNTFRVSISHRTRTTCCLMLITSFAHIAHLLSCSFSGFSCVQNGNTSTSGLVTGSWRCGSWQSAASRRRRKQADLCAVAFVHCPVTSCHQALGFQATRQQRKRRPDPMSRSFFWRMASSTWS